MTSKVFVGNLNFETLENELQDLFSQAGNVVEVFLPMDRATGRPRGFAFVEFDDSDAVAEAIEKFDGYEHRGRALRVNEAQERPRRSGPPMDMGMGGPPRGGRGGGGGGGGYGRPAKPKGSRRNSRAKKRSL